MSAPSFSITAIASTHSHLTPFTEVSRAHWRNFLKDHPNGSPTQFLTDKKGMLPDIAADAA